MSWPRNTPVGWSQDNQKEDGLNHKQVKLLQLYEKGLNLRLTLDRLAKEPVEPVIWKCFLQETNEI